MAKDKYYKNLKSFLVSHKYPFLLTLIIILGLFLRLVNIEKEPYWCDELLSLGVAKHYINNLAEMWDYLRLVDIHPPLYYYLLSFWIKIFGHGEAATRAMSLVFSLGVVWLTYIAGVVFFKNKKIAIVASFLAAILPMQIEYGQEARPYAIYCFFGLASIILLAKYFEAEKKNKKILLSFFYAATSIVGLYLHYSFLLIIIPTASWWLIKIIKEKKSKDFLWWLGTMTIIFLGFYPWLSVFIFKSFLSNNVITNSQILMTTARPFDFMETAMSQLIWTNKMPLSSPVEVFAAFVVKIFVLILVLIIITNGKDHFKKNRSAINFIGWVIVISSLLFLFMPSSNAYTTLLERHLIVDSVLLALLLSFLIVFGLRKSRWILIALGLIVVSLFTLNIKILSDDSLFDINSRFGIVANYINEQYKDGDLLLINDSIVRSDMNYYLRNDIQGFKTIYPTIIGENDLLATRDTLGFVESAFHLLKETGMVESRLNIKMNYLIKKYNPKRVWVVCASDDVKDWFRTDDWRMAFKPIGKLFPVSLYVKIEPTKNK